jgi:hypothetical protein
MVALAAALGGCGGSDSKPASSVAQPPPSATPTVAPTTPVTPAPSTPATPPAPKPPSTATMPDSTPGGGGTERARTELEFTASSSGVSPTQASVAPYIAVRVTLRTTDGTRHKLTIDGRTLMVGGVRRSAFVELHGLPPGRSYRGKADGLTNVVILSSSEPGP